MTILLYELVGQDAARPFSPHCWKSAMALAHKGLEFERVPVPFTSVPTVEGSVSKTVPVIRDGDKVVANSFDIALYLDEAYPDRPTLFGGPGGQAMARFIERWSQGTIHGYLGSAALMDIHDRLAPADQAYFRDSREKRYGKRSKRCPPAARQGSRHSAHRWSLCEACSATSRSSAAPRRCLRTISSSARSSGSA